MITGAYTLLKNWKQDLRNMVHMVRPTTNRTACEVTFVNFDWDKAELAGTEMVLVSGKDGR